MDGVIEPVHRLTLRQLLGRLEDRRGAGAHLRATGFVTRTTSAMFSTPHSPQPERPSIERRTMRALVKRLLADRDVDGKAVLDRHG